MRSVPIALAAALIAATATAPAGATFSGRAGLIARGAEDGIHVMRPDGTRDRLVSRMGPARDPAWGPNGRRIAFSHAGSIWVVDLNDGSTRRVTHGRHDSSPSWSSHGGAIAYSRAAWGSRGLWTVRLSDGRKTRIVADAVDRAEWAPDGAWIAYVVDFNVHLVRPDGGDAHRIVDFSNPGNERPYADSVSWSPDASRLAIGVLLNACTGCNGVYTVLADGSELEPVAGDLRGPPVWSPTGRAIAYCHVRGGQTDDPRYELHALTGHGERYLGPTCGDAWQALPRRAG